MSVVLSSAAEQELLTRLNKSRTAVHEVSSSSSEDSSPDNDDKAGAAAPRPKKRHRARKPYRVTVVDKKVISFRTECVTPGSLSIMTKSVVRNVFNTIRNRTEPRYSVLGKGTYATTYLDRQNPDWVVSERTIPTRQSHMIRFYGKVFEKQFFKQAGTNVLFPHSVVMGVSAAIKRKLISATTHQQRIEEIVKMGLQTANGLFVAYEITPSMDCNYGTFCSRAVPHMDSIARGNWWRESMESMFNGLHFLHEQVGVVHGDCHPGNVLVKIAGNVGDRICLMDFDMNFFLSTKLQVCAFPLLTMTACRLPSAVLINRGRSDFTLPAPKSFDFYSVLPFVCCRIWGRRYEEFFAEFQLDPKFFAFVDRCTCSWQEHEKEACAYPMAVLVSHCIQQHGVDVVLRHFFKWASVAREVPDDPRSVNLITNLRRAFYAALIYGGDSPNRYVHTDRVTKDQVNKLFWLKQLRTRGASSRRAADTGDESEEGEDEGQEEMETIL